MANPHLEITSGKRLPLTGQCSACPSVKFSPKDGRKGEIEQLAYMRALFDQHLVTAHKIYFPNRENGIEDAIAQLKRDEEK